MTTPIQAAIEALTAIGNYCSDFYANAKVRGAEAAHTRAHEMAQLAETTVFALQAAQPVQSIDTDIPTRTVAEVIADIATGGGLGRIDRLMKELDRAHIAQRAPADGYQHDSHSAEHIATVLAQRAPVADAPAIPSGVFYSDEDDSFYEIKSLGDMGVPFWFKWRYRSAEFPTDAAAPIADEVAGAATAWMTSDRKHIVFGDRFKNQDNPSTAGMIPLYERPPAPTASAEPVAGEFPPLPEPDYIIDAMHGELRAHSDDQMHAYVLADRAARQSVSPLVEDFEEYAKRAGLDLSHAQDMEGENGEYPASYWPSTTEAAWRAWANKPAAAAPAGHAEPVAWASSDKIGNGLRAFTKFATTESEIDRFVAAHQAQYSGADRIKVALFAAPVAAEHAEPVKLQARETSARAWFDLSMHRRQEAIERGWEVRELFAAPVAEPAPAVPAQAGADMPAAFAHNVLVWNREQTPPPIQLGREHGVAVELWKVAMSHLGGGHE